MTTLFNRSQRSLQPQAVKGLGDILSEDSTTRVVEIAFMERYAKAAFKVSKRTLQLARLQSEQPAAKSGSHIHGVDKLEAQVMTDFTLVRSPAFAKIAREMEKNLPADATFGKFRANGG
ncbi:hypothetical protein [Polaromonas sp. CG_23.6]|uniref:hypothetical protein n=1 Tax=Polaromonas sp. CG_23.6 TaxID=2760709 RepID=UPI0024757B3A|nr:hypothetical protein [Polaromonas sp. CG_23.6]MDH6186766.1 hypothetical protein [Polaromonas sp. CG_23.6]